jgi:hypothetical protein
MKKLYLTGFVALALACDVLEPENAVPAGSDGGMVEMTAVLADAPLDARTTLAGDAVRFAWSADDAILTIGSEGVQTVCPVTAIDADGTAHFSVPAGTTYAFYPSDPAPSLSGSVLSCKFPTVQTLSEAGGERVGGGANPMFAHADGDKLRFTNLGGILMFQLKGTKTLKALTFKSNNMKTPALSGAATFNVTGDAPQAELVAGNGNGHYGYVKVTGREIPLSTATPAEVCVVVPAATYEESMVILEFTDGSAYSYITPKAITVSRSKITRLNPFNVDELLPKNPVDLSENGTSRSNCYLVIAGAEPQAYSFEAKKILGEGFTGGKIAQIHWTESPSLFNNVCYDAATETISFLYGGNNEEGNATIVLDTNNLNSAECLWSWHLWATDRPKDVILKQPESSPRPMPNYLLDRNVGATWAPATVSDIDNMTAEQAIQSVGVYHQYGNHITFPRVTKFEVESKAYANTAVKAIYGFSYYVQKQAQSSAIKKTLVETQKYPNYFYHKKINSDASGRLNGMDVTLWVDPDETPIVGGPSGDGYNLWETSPTLHEKTNDHDPCPQGYVIVTATDMYNCTYDFKFQYRELAGAGESGLLGMWNADEAGNFLWFPAAGYMGQGAVKMIGRRVVHWTYYTGTEMMTYLCRRTLADYTSNHTAFNFGNVPVASQGHNTRCRKL